MHQRLDFRPNVRKHILAEKRVLQLGKLAQRVAGEIHVECREQGKRQRPGEADYACVFRRKAAGHSDASQPVIPTETSHPFRGNPATPDPG